MLMCTPALRALKRLRPECRIQFYTDRPSLVRGLPYIDDVMPAGARPSARSRRTMWRRPVRGAPLQRARKQPRRRHRRPAARLRR